MLTGNVPQGSKPEVAVDAEYGGGVETYGAEARCRREQGAPTQKHGRVGHGKGGMEV